MSYSHLSTIDRGQLEALHRLGWSCRKIGRELGRHPSTTAREPKRGGSKQGEVYAASFATGISRAENFELACRQVYRSSCRRAQSEATGDVVA
ncbi:helix-turn-helix domain-containing protein [Paenibacillus glucanolyticus]|uniref:helix-turn-helix domain-containing protein n=1 Tax=Paenibacillus glucanolyticus TaxID=59843 RepID=UPI0036B3302E